MTGVLAALLAVGIPMAMITTDWAAIVKPATKQVPRLEILKDGSDTPGICSGVVINKAAGYVLTAAHCVQGDAKHLSVTVNGRHAEIARANRLLDLAIVRTILKDEQEMALALASPDIGAEVAVLGYAFGVEKMAVQFGRVSQFNGETKTLWLNLDLIFGDSGGPAIDAHGHLIGINSRIYYSGPAHMAAVVPVEQVRDFVEAYLPAKKQ